MNMDFQIDGDVAIVQLEGRFSLGSDAELVRVKDGLTESGRRNIIVDCSQVAFLDSTALNFLVGLYTTAKNLGGGFSLCGLNARMREVLRVTHLDEIIPIHDTRESAIAAVSGN
jgi:anti-sigma B factor antagonist